MSTETPACLKVESASPRDHFAPEAPPAELKHRRARPNLLGVGLVAAGGDALEAAGGPDDGAHEVQQRLLAQELGVREDLEGSPTVHLHAWQSRPQS